MHKKHETVETVNVGPLVYPLIMIPFTAPHPPISRTPHHNFPRPLALHLRHVRQRQRESRQNLIRSSSWGSLRSERVAVERVTPPSRSGGKQAKGASSRDRRTRRQPLVVFLQRDQEQRNGSAPQRWGRRGRDSAPVGGEILIVVCFQLHAGERPLMNYIVD